MSELVTAEQLARDMLERSGVEDAQSFTAGDVVELANLISKVEAIEAENARLRRELQQTIAYWSTRGELP